jgi:hypothetical protein
LVDEYNRRLDEIPKTARGNPGPLTLPVKFDPGDCLILQDLRLSKRFAVRERRNVQILDLSLS